MRIGFAAHGLSVLMVERDPGGGLRPVPDPRFNRRITATSQLQLTGPAAGSPLLRTADDPTGTRVLGTLNNCAGGVTPWGTVLSAEENFNYYFGNAALVADPVAKQRLARYGVKEAATERKWERFDARFDVSQELNGPHRFGWVVERDPQDPTVPVVKHTALGRFKHEGATIRVAPDGRVVVYMGDDEVFDYVYKFVSDERDGARQRPPAACAEPAAARYWYVVCREIHRQQLAAQIDGSGWLPAGSAFEGSGEWVPLARNRESFVPGMTAEEVYVFTRVPSTYFAGFDKSQVSPISCPDNLAFDRYGNLWISTDGNELGFNDGLYGVALHGEQRGLAKLFATVPVGAEACGPVIEEHFVLVSPQHPGDSDDASPDKPASRWPDGGNGQPRPSVAVVYRDGGSPIGF